MNSCHVKVLVNKPLKFAGDTLVKGSEYAAGYDIRSNDEGTFLAPGERRAFSTGLCIAIEHGFWGEIMPRSGLAVKYGVDKLAGVIDSDYRGEVMVIIINHGTDTLHVKPGDKIAQLIIHRIVDTNFEMVSSLDNTERGVGGFGSTGR